MRDLQTWSTYERLLRLECETSTFGIPMRGLQGWSYSTKTTPSSPIKNENGKGVTGVKKIKRKYSRTTPTSAHSQTGIKSVYYIITGRSKQSTYLLEYSNINIAYKAVHRYLLELN